MAYTKELIALMRAAFDDAAKVLKKPAHASDFMRFERWLTARYLAKDDMDGMEGKASKSSRKRLTAEAQADMAAQGMASLDELLALELSLFLGRPAALCSRWRPWQSPSYSPVSARWDCGR